MRVWSAQVRRKTSAGQAGPPAARTQFPTAPKPLPTALTRPSLPPSIHPSIHVPPTPEHGVPGEAIAEAYDAFEKGTVVSPLAAAAVSNQTIQESMKLVLLVRAFQVRVGVLCAAFFGGGMCVVCVGLGRGVLLVRAF